LNHQAQGKEPAVTGETAPILAALWSEELADIPTEALDSVFKATIRTSKWFPTIADIRAQADSAQQTNCEDEWQAVLDYVRDWEWGDGPGGLLPGAPRLSVELDHAVRAAGGIRRLSECTREELVWAKKEFVADRTRMRQTGDLAGLLTGGEAKKILKEITTPPARLQVAPAAKKEARTAQAPLPVPDPALKVESNRKRTASRELTHAELEEEARRQKAALVAKGYDLTPAPSAARATVSFPGESCS